jgi:hypothetical protein
MPSGARAAIVEEYAQVTALPQGSETDSS